MRRATMLLLALLAIGGCRKKDEKPKEESVHEAMDAKPVTVVLVTGDVLQLDLMMEDGDAYLLKGNQGTGRFPKVLIRKMSDTPAERPAAKLPGTDLLDSKPRPMYVGKSDGRVFHKLNCRQAGHIPEGERVEFLTRDEALRRGYKPCGLCNP